jgi:integrase/recombinase XerD
MNNEEQYTTLVRSYDFNHFVRVFMLYKESTGVTKGTLRFYHYKLKLFGDYCNSPIDQISPTDIRVFLNRLSKTHSPGDVEGAYRALKTLFNFFAFEVEPKDWRNPFDKVSRPKVPLKPLEPITIEDIKKLLAVCGPRDYCLLLFLLDSGARSFEALSVLISDANLVTGEIMLRRTKGGKYRVVFIGTKTKKALRSYLKTRTDDCPALFVTDDGHRLTYLGLRSIMHRRCKDAGIPQIKIHGWRRTFALSFLNSGGSLESLRRILGHADFSSLNRYLNQSTKDLALAHRQHSPVDNLL